MALEYQARELAREYPARELPALRQQEDHPSSAHEPAEPTDVVQMSDMRSAVQHPPDDGRALTAVNNDLVPFGIVR